MERARKVLFWTTSYAELLTGGKPGGIGVQIMFWSQVFGDNGWQVYSLFDKKEPDRSNKCIFLKDKETHPSTIILYLFFAINLLKRVKPKLVICRGGSNRNLFFIALCCKFFGVKLVQFFGSDADMRQTTKGLSTNVKLNNLLFRWGLKLTNHFVVQNESQRQQLTSQFRDKHHIVIPNVWGNVVHNSSSCKHGVILWVGNTRKLKRPQWVFNIAESFPDEKFVIIGGNADNGVYNDCIELEKKAHNVDFLGGLPFWETSNWFKNAKILLCTSEYEGFPNTFLQAWSNSVPVLSTVDPSNIIKKKKLGKICRNPAEFVINLNEILKEKEYIAIQINIDRYFKDAHSLQANYNNLIRFLNL